MKMKIRTLILVMMLDHTTFMYVRRTAQQIKRVATTGLTAIKQLKPLKNFSALKKLSWKKREENCFSKLLMKVLKNKKYIKIASKKERT